MFGYWIIAAAIGQLSRVHLLAALVIVVLQPGTGAPVHDAQKTQHCDTAHPLIAIKPTEDYAQPAPSQDKPTGR